MRLGGLPQPICKIHQAAISDQHIVNDGPIPNGVEFRIVGYSTAAINAPFCARRQKINWNTIAAAIIVGFGVERLMGITDQMNNESERIRTVGAVWIILEDINLIGDRVRGAAILTQGNNITHTL